MLFYNSICGVDESQKLQRINKTLSKQSWCRSQRVDSSEVLAGPSNKLKAQRKIRSVQRLGNIRRSNNNSGILLGKNKSAPINRYFVTDKRSVISLTFIIFQ